MQISEIRQKRRTLHAQISAGQLISSIAMLNDAARETSCHSISERLEDISFAYNTMLDYYTGGADDPQRNIVHHSITEKLHELVDDWSDEATDQHGSESLKSSIAMAYNPEDWENSTEYYRDLQAQYALARTVDANASVPIKLTSVIEDLFNTVWAMKPSREACEMIYNFVNDKELPAHDRELIVGAMVLGIAHRFIPGYVEIFLKLCDNETPRIAARAMVGIFIALIVHTSRWENYPALKAHLEALAEQPGMRSQLFETFVVIERSRVVKSIEEKVKNEITPELLKARNKLGDKLGLDALQKNESTRETDWDELFRNSPKLKHSFEQLSRWQTEGADIFLPTFRHLKDFNFFSHLCNWLLPFYKSQPLLVEAIKNEPDLLRKHLAEKIETSFSMCDSDKYSILLSFSYVPAANKEALCSMYDAELRQSEDVFSEGVALDKSKTVVALANQFVQDLYRLFNLHPRRREFPDIFAEVPDFHNTEIFKSLFADIDYNEILGEFYARHELYVDASQMYDNQLIASKETDVVLIRKAAYCRMKSDNIDGALELFLQADIAEDNNIWTKRKIAQCYRKLRKFKTALAYLQQAEALAPENMQIKYSLGNCLLETGNTAEALKYYFEVEYNQPANGSIVRPIAWCSFVEKKLEQADNYVAKIAREGFTSHDFMLLGHIRLCQGRRKEAIAAYRSSLAKFLNFNEFTAALRADVIHLEANGIHRSDIPIILDAVLRGC